MKHIVNFFKGILFLFLFYLRMMAGLPFFFIAIFIAIGEGNVANSSENPAGKILNKLWGIEGELC